MPKKKKAKISGHTMIDDEDADDPDYAPRQQNHLSEESCDDFDESELDNPVATAVRPFQFLCHGSEIYTGLENTESCCR